MIARNYTIRLPVWVAPADIRLSVDRVWWAWPSEGTKWSERSKLEMKVLYDKRSTPVCSRQPLRSGFTTEAFVAAAERNWLTPAAAARGEGDDLDRAMLPELLAVRTAMRRTG